MTWSNIFWRLGLLWRIQRRRWSVVVRFRAHRITFTRLTFGRNLEQLRQRSAPRRLKESVEATQFAVLSATYADARAEIYLENVYVSPAPPPPKEEPLEIEKHEPDDVLGIEEKARREAYEHRRIYLSYSPSGWGH